MTTSPEFQAAYARLTSHGWLSEAEAWLLWRYAQQTEGTLVEFGTYQGRSAMLLAQLGRPLYCVDPWDDSFSTDYSGDEILHRFRGNLASLPGGGAGVTICRCRVEDWQPVSAGLVYCDGDHTHAGTQAQLRRALECVPQVIACHDVNNDGQGRQVMRACLELLGDWQARVGRLAVWEIRT